MKNVHGLLDIKKISKLVFLNLLSGGMSFLFLYIINRLINALVDGELNKFNYQYTIFYACIVVSFIITKRLLSKYVIQSSQNLSWGLRKEIVSLVLRLNYEQFTGRKDQILTVISRDIFTLSNAYLNVILFSASLVSVFACSIYLGVISFPLFLLTLFCIICAVSVYLIKWNKYKVLFEKSRVLETDFMGHINSILNGFKEVLIDKTKGEKIFKEKIIPLAAESMEYKSTSLIGFLNNQLIGEIMMFSLIGLILIFFKFSFDIPSNKVVNFLFVLMYLRNEIENMMAAIPEILQARVSSDRITELKDLLISNSRSLGELNKPEGPVDDFDFRFIHLNNITYNYDSSPSNGNFTIGPIDLTVRKGDVIFIYGGNGSGKTSLVFLILGLLKFKEGNIYLNGQDILGEDSKNYLNLFSVVFADFYLFKELYGVGIIDQGRFEYYLELFEINDKVQLNGKQFSTLDLSTGQRKRLALIAALMENKKVLVLDEWAADQDPGFRHKFYKIILPILKNQGLTIIAITHDDKYYDCADKIYQMEYGKLDLYAHQKTEFNS